MIIYSNRPVNRTSKRARTAERRTTLAAVLLTFSVIATLATAKRIFESNGDRDDLSDAAALAYAAVAEPETTSGPADSVSTAVGDIVVTDIIA